MPSQDWNIIYGTYSGEELSEEIASLKTQLRNPYVSQTEGGSSYSRSIADIRDRLAAAVSALKALTGNSPSKCLYADFGRFTQI